MSERARAERRLPDAELDVLAALRRAGEATAAELNRALADRRPLVHGSVATLLTRLEARGLVARRKGDVGKAFLYRPTARADVAIRGLVDGLVARVFGGDRMRFVASFLESAPPTPAEAARLETLLRELKTAPRPRKGAR